MFFYFIFLLLFLEHDFGFEQKTYQVIVRCLIYAPVKRDGLDTIAAMRCVHKNVTMVGNVSHPMSVNVC